MSDDAEYADGEQQMGFNDKLRRCDQLKDRIEKGNADDEEIEEFIRLRKELHEDTMEAVDGIFNAYQEFMQNLAESVNEAFEPLIQADDE